MIRISGSCSCNSIQVEVKSDEIKRVVNCHCKLCRKMNGSAFSTYVVVFDDGFQIKDKNNQLHIHNITQNAKKAFCKNCGTAIYNINPRYSGLKIVYLGILDGNYDYLPQINLFCSSKLDWVNQVFDAKNYEQGI